MLDSKKSNFENTVLVGVISSNQQEFKLNEYLEELEFLTKTAGGKVVKRFKQKILSPNPKFFIEDGLHLNVAGYDLWTNIVRDRIGRTLD